MSLGFALWGVVGLSRGRGSLRGRCICPCTELQADGAVSCLCILLLSSRDLSSGIQGARLASWVGDHLRCHLLLINFNICTTCYSFYLTMKSSARNYNTVFTFPCNSYIFIF